MSFLKEINDKNAELQRQKQEREIGRQKGNVIERKRVRRTGRKIDSDQPKKMD